MVQCVHLNEFFIRKNIAKGVLPIHSFNPDSTLINILPLDHTNPYDFKREHRHTYFEIILIEKGGCNQLVDFKNYAGQNFSCYIVCPQQVHLMNRNASSGTVVQFTEENIASTEIRAVLRQIPFYENSAVIFEDRQDLFEDLKSILQILGKQLNAGDNYLAVSGLLEAFIALVLAYRDVREQYEKSLTKKLLIDFYLLLENHYKENVGVQFFIDQLATTEKKLAETIKKHTGLSPLQVIHNRILLEAKRILLFEETSHKEIAYELGFDSPASFSAFIKSKTTYSPVELKKHLAEIHK